MEYNMNEIKELENSDQTVLAMYQNYIAQCREKISELQSFLNQMEALSNELQKYGIARADDAMKNGESSATTGKAEDNANSDAENGVEAGSKPEVQKADTALPESCKANLPLHEQIKAEKMAKQALKNARRERKLGNIEKSQQAVAPMTPKTLAEMLEQKGNKAEFLLDTVAILRCPMELLERYSSRLWASRYSLNSVRGIAQAMEAKTFVSQSLGAHKAEEALEKVEFFQAHGNVMDVEVNGNELLGNLSIKLSHRIQGGTAKLFIGSSEKRFFLVGSSSLYDVCLDNGLNEAQVLYDAYVE